VVADVFLVMVGRCIQATITDLPRRSLNSHRLQHTMQSCRVYVRSNYKNNILSHSNGMYFYIFIYKPFRGAKFEEYK